MLHFFVYKLIYAVIIILSCSAQVTIANNAASVGEITLNLPTIPPSLSLSIVKEEEFITPESVRIMLNRNLHNVLSGKRAREFAVLYSQRSDSFSGIYSAHGRTYSAGKKEVEKKVIKILSELETQNQLSAPSIFTLCTRATKLGFNFAPCISTIGLAYVSSSFRRNIWYKLLTSCIAKSGPAFIKWGQWASTRSDMFEKELCWQLSSLHFNAPEHPWEFTQATVEEALSLPSGTLFQVFDSFDSTPLASGSIAQIHKAVLRPESSSSSFQGKPGPPIAIKVRHPMVAELIDWDFRIMLRLADVVDSVPALKWLNVRSSVEQFSHTMAAQAHLDIEAHHLEVLNYNFRRWKAVGFPRPYFATSSIICETFERGEVVTTVIDKYDDKALQHGKLGYELIPLDLARFLVTNGLAVYLKMLLVDNLMHADLHPGNIMVCMNHHRDDSKKVGTNISLTKDAHPQGEKFNMILVDAGMVAQLDEEECVNFIGFLASLGEGDGRRAAEKILQFSSPADDYCLTDREQEKFIDDVLSLFATNCQGYGTKVDVGIVLREILLLIRIHKVRIAANYATLVINVLCIESLARRVAPEYNLLDAAKPLLQSYDRITGHGSKSQSRLRRNLIKFWMPFMYMKKRVSDNIFFFEQAVKRGEHTSFFSRTSEIAFATFLVVVTVRANNVSVLDFFKKRRHLFIDE